MAGVLFQRQVGVGRVLRTSHPPSTPKGPAQIEIPDDLQGHLQLFALAGQSNMVGLAPLPPEQRPLPRAFVFGNDYRWHEAKEPVDDPTDQVDLVSRDISPELGTGPGVAFARAVLGEEPEAAIGLVPCARGATSLHEWGRALGDDTLYGSCLKRLAAAAPMGRVAGVLFFQGEADATAPTADDYAARFTTFVEDLRRDLGRPRLPVVFAQIGSTTTPNAFPHWRKVQEQQASVHLPCVAMITTADLPLKDNVHFTTESYQEIGRRFARAYLELVTREACE
ncbi:MAG TPA: sialate O-acetylesterase [Candidatus Polarisedimenticolaceae bacterium]|nr:sialate O-acetylesterase [Candidatus Polarisedimenticolaceae bacterium]